MTHDDLANNLRETRPFISDNARTAMYEAADRLDRYRDLLERCLPQLNDKWADERDLIEQICEALK
jgi:hypothetical protein